VWSQTLADFPGWAIIEPEATDVDYPLTWTIGDCPDGAG
jgi:hypothetical protein